MTCVVAWRDERGTWMAADGRTYNGNDILTSTCLKVAQRDGVLIGHSGDSRMGRAADEVAIPDGPRDLPWMRRLFDGLDDLMESYHVARTDNDGWNGVWLVAASGGLYGGSSREPVELDGNYASLGAGDDLASGALYVLENDLLARRVEPKHALEMAIKAAIRHTSAVGGQISHWFQEAS